MNASRVKRLSTLLFVITSLLIALPAAAKDTTDYDGLCKSGSAAEIQNLLKSKPSLQTQVFGSNRETYLMLALKYDRGADVIEVLLKGGLKVEATAKDKRTPLMFACQYSSSQEVIEKVINYNAVLSSARKNRINTKDASGKTCFDYAKLNENIDAYSILLTYTPDPANKTVTVKKSEASTAESSRTNSVTFTYGSTATAADTKTEEAPAETKAEETPAPAAETSETAASQSAETEEKPLTKAEQKKAEAEAKKAAEAAKKAEAAAKKAAEEQAKKDAAAAKKAEEEAKKAAAAQAKKEAEEAKKAAKKKTDTSAADEASRTNEVTFTYNAAPAEETAAAPEAKAEETPAPVQPAETIQPAEAVQPAPAEEKQAPETTPVVEEKPAPAPAPAEPVKPAEEEKPAPAVEEKPAAASPSVAERLASLSEPAVTEPEPVSVPVPAETAKIAETAPVETVKPAVTAPVETKPQVTEVKPYTQTYLYDYAIMDNQVPEEEPAKKTVYFEDPDLADSNGVTLLMKAAKAGNDWDLKNLLEAGADVNLRDNDGWTALMYAARYQNNASIIRTLIDNGAYVRVRNIYNATPLILAADYSQNPEIISILLENRSASENEVYNAFILALTSNVGAVHIQQAKLQLFLNLDIAVNRIWKGKTPLMYACQYCTSTEIIQQLLDYGAKTAIQDASGKTAFDYAKTNSKLERNEVFWSLNSIN